MMQGYVLLLLIVATVLQGCGSDTATDAAGTAKEITTLRKQVAALTRQVEDAHVKIGTLRDTSQETNRLLMELKTEVDRLKEREVPPLAQAAEPRENENEHATPAPQKVVKIACPQVWKLIGQGKDEETVARTLNTTREVVRACEQQIGRGGFLQ